MDNRRGRSVKSFITGRVVPVMASVLLLGNVFTVSARAESVITVDAGNAAASSQSAPSNDVKTISNLRVINLAEPVNFGSFDTSATIISDEGYSWEIPVVWADEEGKYV